jgi:hypothetical protein
MWAGTQETLMLAILVIAGFCSLFALGLAVECRSRSIRALCATIVAAMLLTATIGYLELATKRLPTATEAHAEPAPVSQSACVRQGVAPACNCGVQP